MIKKLIFLSVCLGLLLTTTKSYAEEEKIKFTQTWEQVDGACGYRVEIQNSKSQMVVSEDVSQNSLDLELPTGLYQIKISGLNVFGYAETATDWVKFVVRKIETPVIQKTLPRHAQEATPFTLRIQATGIDGKTKWQLVNAEDSENGKPVSALNLSFEGSEYCDVHFPGLAPGLYSLEAVGRTGKTGSSPNALYVTEHDPMVTSFEPRKIEPQSSFSMQIGGKYLQQVEKVELVSSDDGRETIKSVLPVQNSETVLKANFPALRSGSYTVVVTSLNSQKIILQNSFQVLMPKPMLKGVQVLENRHQLVVDGLNWTAGMQVFLSQDSRRQALKVIGQTDTRLIAEYPENLAVGKYGLILGNNQGNENLYPSSVEIKTAFSLSLQQLNEEEFQPVSVTLIANAKKDNLGWVLAGVDCEGKQQSVPAQSATWVAEQSAWHIEFPGMPQGKYRIQTTGLPSCEVDFPHEIVVSDHTPLMTKMIPEKAEAQQSFKWELWGQYLKSGGKLEFVSANDGSSYPVDVTVSANDTNAEGMVAGLPSGYYALKATSPQGKTCTRDAALYVQIPLPIVDSFEQHAWDADKALLKTALTGSKLLFASKAFLSLQGVRTEILIDESSDAKMTVAYPSSLGCGTYDLILATADGRETVVPSGVEIKVPALMKVGSVIHDSRQPLVVRMRAPGVKADCEWQLVGNNVTGQFVPIKPAEVKDEGNDLWTIRFSLIPEGSYHLCVMCPNGKKLVFPGNFEIGDLSKHDQ